jgi:integrase
LQEKTLWQMLYETAARASEILALNVEDLNLEQRRGAHPIQGRRHRVPLLGHRGRAPAAPAAAPARRHLAHQRAGGTDQPVLGAGVSPVPADRRAYRTADLLRCAR